MVRGTAVVNSPLTMRYYDEIRFPSRPPSTIRASPSVAQAGRRLVLS
jgi:hypothetical protein